MSRSKVGPAMAFLAGAALFGATAADAAPATWLIVLDDAKLDSVNAGSYLVGVDVRGEADAQGGSGSNASVDYKSEASGDAEQGSAFGLVHASGFGLSGEGLPARTSAKTEASAQGNVVNYTRTFEFNRQSAHYSISESISAAFAYSMAPIDLR